MSDTTQPIFDNTELTVLEQLIKTELELAEATILLSLYQETLRNILPVLRFLVEDLSILSFIGKDGSINMLGIMKLLKKITFEIEKKAALTVMDNIFDFLNNVNNIHIIDGEISENEDMKIIKSHVEKIAKTESNNM